MDSVSAFIIANDKERGPEQITQSLSPIIDDMIDVKRQTNPMDQDIETNTVLGALAQAGHAAIGKTGEGQSIWVASPELVNTYVMGLEWTVSLGDQRNPILRLDAVLRAEIDRHWQISRSKHRSAENERLFTCSWLLMLERRGDAIAYINRLGQLAWKASTGFVCRLNGAAD